MSKRKRRFHLRLSEREYEKLEMIRAAHNVSLNKIIRTLLHAGLIQFGFENGIPEEFEK
jgi:predicted HicB family RNase H-like nuclease